MNFNYKNQRSLFIVCILLSHLTLHCAPPQKTLEEKLTQGGIEAAAFWLFIFPTLDFNQYCPPTDQIPILEPGNHSIFLSEGQSYFFDNRARLEGFTSSSDFSTKEFTFIFQENPGQDVKLESPYCGQNERTIPSDNDSGLKGQLESVNTSLANPFRSGRRANFAKLTSTIGSGTILLTSPSIPNPPN
jgi:hypothetical protein